MWPRCFLVRLAELYRYSNKLPENRNANADGLSTAQTISIPFKSKNFAVPHLIELWTSGPNSPGITPADFLLLCPVSYCISWLNTVCIQKKRAFINNDDESQLTISLNYILLLLHWLELIGEYDNAFSAMEAVRDLKPEITVFDGKIPTRTGADVLGQLASLDFVVI